MPTDRVPSVTVRSGGPRYSRAQRRLLTAAAGLVVAALAAGAFALTYDTLRDLAVSGRVDDRWAPIYPAMADGLITMTLLSLVVTRGARWWTRLLRWTLLLLLAAGVAALAVQDAVWGLDPLPDEPVRAGVAVAPHVMLVLAVWLWLTMFKQIRLARPAGEAVEIVETQRGHVKVLPALEAPAGEAGEAGGVPALEFAGDAGEYRDEYLGEYPGDDGPARPSGIDILPGVTPVAAVPEAPPGEPLGGLSEGPPEGPPERSPEGPAERSPEGPAEGPAERSPERPAERSAVAPPGGSTVGPPPGPVVGAPPGPAAIVPLSGADPSLAAAPAPRPAPDEFPFDEPEPVLDRAPEPARPHADERARGTGRALEAPAGHEHTPHDRTWADVPAQEREGSHGRGASQERRGAAADEEPWPDHESAPARETAPVYESSQGREASREDAGEAEHEAPREHARTPGYEPTWADEPAAEREPEPEERPRPVPALLPTDVEVARAAGRPPREARPLTRTTRPDIAVPGVDDHDSETPDADRPEDPDAGVEDPDDRWEPHPPPSNNFRSGPTPPAD
ncbi:DUF2637 domain-containing protein [Actinomadura sp. WMMB 499]|uniref:DUF2637 domain-containing protein n=1 Tax=Actinomadura sp. WMMB 499 TaxID=1219491 RepID=UPI0012453C5F|nr:DUF2637 domain-containing protein [Actinomadura sp. WMMB 499]QFG21970.1 DUF2637 domain-containing protein [Actinomadura sp. WMMB 499]